MTITKKPQARLFNKKKFRQTLATRQLTQFVDVAVDVYNGGKIQTLLNALLERQGATRGVN